MDEVTDATFSEEVLSSSIPVVVDFWAPWCRPCDAIEPHLRALADEWQGLARFVKVNVDENLGVSGRYGVLSLPTVMLFSDGVPRATVHGAQPRSRFERDFGPFLATG
jgi:thioredoxin 1